ncbi:MAG: 3-ketoacyl-ACP reductase [Clostridia bacterium]|nr:3-ketoacyl-ACP reductase [Clostridia bacterium]
MTKTAIITGAMGGIGYAAAQLLTQNGFHVVGMDIVTADACADRIAALGENFVYISGNLADASDRQALLDTALSHFGAVHALVNVAGVAPKFRRDLLEMTEESYDFVMDINTKGTLFLSQLVANQILKQEDRDAVGNRGYIVNISSCSAYTSSTSRGEYCVSKAGVSMVTMLFADRLAGEGIPVNEICPGIIATGMTAVVKEKYDKLIAEGLVPQARWGLPEDIAKAILSLVDGTLGYTTGQSLIVDGGMHIRRL